MSGCFTLVVNYPKESYGEYVRKMTRGILDEYSHVAILNSGVRIIDESDFYSLPERYPDADIICVNVIPSSRVFRIWEKMTYWARLAPPMRGQAVIYSSAFLKWIGGYPQLYASADTWLLQRSRNTVIASDVSVVHREPFSLKDSFWRQIRDGEGRFFLKYSLWKTVLHSVFRLRPFVGLAYIYYRLKTNSHDSIFQRRWKRNAKKI